MRIILQRVNRRSVVEFRLRRLKLFLSQCKNLILLNLDPLCLPLLSQQFKKLTHLCSQLVSLPPQLLVFSLKGVSFLLNFSNS